ncbi:DinB family protein [Streptomyces sp. JNUCC 64]
MTTTRIDLLRWQSDLTWALFAYHLERLQPADFLAEPPVAHVWTVRPAPDGTWVPDWADSEPDPVPVPTVAWLTWHIGWWWSTTLDHLAGRTPPERAEVTWPGDGAAAVAWLRELRARWTTTLDGLADTDLDAPASFPADDPGYTVAHQLAWVNAELMKNAAEIGRAQLLLRAAS